MTDTRRLIATDVDGTLLDSHKRISAFTREVFQRLHAEPGTEIALVSSRMPNSLGRVEEELGVPCWKIAYDGLHFGGPGNEPLEFGAMPGIALAEATKLLGEVPTAMVAAYSGNTWYCNADNEWSRREAYNTQVEPIVSRDLAAEMVRHEGTIHKLMFRDHAQRIAELGAALGAHHFASARWFSNGPTILEVVPSSANKAAALSQLVEYLRVDPEQVIVFGDGANDLPVFDRFANSVAVANAIPPLKELARYLTEKGVADGVARFLAARIMER